MYIGKESKAYLDKVVQNNALMGSDVCTGAMQGVMKFLGSGAPTAVADFNSARNGLYSLVINFGGDINTKDHKAGWEHGMAIQKIGDDLVLYQAWVLKFSLSDWLLSDGAVGKYQANSFGPMHAKSSSEAMKEWILRVRNLGALAADAGAFCAAAEALFGPPAGGVGLMQVRSASAPLRYHWKYCALKAIDEIIAPNLIVG